MYVKSQLRDAVQIFAVNDDELATGYHTFREAPTHDQVIEHVKLDPASTVIRFDVEDSPTFVGVEDSGWIISYAYWWDWEKAFNRLVATQGKIYILGDKGQTIDRVN